ncbi:MAG: GIY-YIG nuclease family protein [Spirochaetes bacterium]|nr:GIY-YIG nuclease family protein [Spirochaetota bacterium]
MYILECADGTYYTGSTWNLEKRINEHQNGKGAKYTSRRFPVTLVYFEQFISIRDAFNREKQIQGWSHAKKSALIEKNHIKLHELSVCKNKT